MKIQILFILFGLAILGTSCDKHKEHYADYFATETRTYDGEMMSPSVDLSDQSYLLTVESMDRDRVILKNIYEQGSRIETEINGSILTIRKQSLDGFLDIDGNGTIDNGYIHLNFNVITPDGSVLCDLHARIVE